MRKKNQETMEAFVDSMMTCQFCDEAGHGFDTEEQYKSHLVTRHGVRKNLDMLLDLSVKIKTGGTPSTNNIPIHPVEQQHSQFKSRNSNLNMSKPYRNQNSQPRDRRQSESQRTDKRRESFSSGKSRQAEPRKESKTEEPKVGSPVPQAPAPAESKIDLNANASSGIKYSEIVKKVSGSVGLTPVAAIQANNDALDISLLAQPARKDSKKSKKADAPSEKVKENNSAVIAEVKVDSQNNEKEEKAKTKVEKVDKEVAPEKKAQSQASKKSNGEVQVADSESKEKGKAKKVETEKSNDSEVAKKTTDKNQDDSQKKKQKPVKPKKNDKQKESDELDALVKKINAKPKASKKGKGTDVAADASNGSAVQQSKQERSLEDKLADIDEGSGSSVIAEQSPAKKVTTAKSTKEDDKKVKSKETSAKKSTENKVVVDEFQIPSVDDINMSAKPSQAKPTAKPTKTVDKVEAPKKSQDKVKKAEKENEVNKQINAILPNIDEGASSGVLGKSDLDEVNDILDEWFRGEGGDDDDDLPDELPDVEDDLEDGSSSPRIVEIEDTPVVELPVPQAEPETEPAVPCGDCIVCGTLAKASCSVCKHVWYCTREHQKRDWTNHKDVCKEFAKLPYRVERSPKLGRYLVAMRELEEGELILQDSPMVVGPRQLTKPVCLGCHKEINLNNSTKCIRCNWPVCSRKCQDSEMHLPECRATQAAGSRIKVEVFGQTNMMYACITVLRALSLQEGPKKIWEDYTRFDSHLEERLKTPVYNKVNKEKVVFFILHYLGIRKYSDLEIMEACGKLDTNCFEIRLNGLNLRAMYRTACLISHDCHPNTRHTFAPDNSINVYTTRRIKKGDVISATYTNSLWSTYDRREHLKMSKCFWCDCGRCRDPTEFKSFMSAIACSRCRGFSDDVQTDDLQFIVSTNPLDREAPWRCIKCTNVQKGSQIQAGNMLVANELKTTNKSSVESLLVFLKKHEPILGPTNHLIVEVKYTVVSLLGNTPQYPLENLTMQLLIIKEKFSRELLSLADKIEPGSSRWRGTILLELQMALVALAAGQAEAEMISKGQAKKMAEEAMQLLNTATNILRVEPDMITILEERMKSVSLLLGKWEE